MKFRENMNSLSVISDAYSRNRISAEEYRTQRAELLSLIDEELNGITVQQQVDIPESCGDDDSLLDKALSFLKLDKLKETN